MSLPTLLALDIGVYAWSAVCVGPMVLGEGESRPSHLGPKIRLGADTTALAELTVARRPVEDEQGTSNARRLTEVARSGETHEMA